jgi:phosphoglycolate phosphatase-like HAD superfamily hydrolase
MFREMRSALGIPKSVDILDHVRSLSNEPDNSSSENSQSSPQSRARRLIEDIERNAMSVQKPQPGLVELMKYLEERRIPKALCTRNFPAPVTHLIDTFLSELKVGFDMIITRDTEGVLPKPSPEGLWKIAQNWGLDNDLDGEWNGDLEVKADDALEVAKRVLGQGMIMVGDSIDDMAAGFRAGAATVLLANDENEALSEHEYTDLSVRRLDDLVTVLEKGFVGRE